MHREPFEMDRLEQLLRQTAERQVPADLERKIMDKIIANHAAESPAVRLRRWLSQKVILASWPLRWGFSLAMVAVVFWLGTLAGGRNQGQMSSVQTQESAIAPFADSARANFLVGRGLLEAGKQQLALEFLQQAVQQEPRSAEYGHWQGVAYWKLGDREKERQSYQQSIARQPDYIPALLNLGHNLLESGDYQQALRQYEKVLQVNPYEQTALYNRALAYLQLADHVGARAAFGHYLDYYRSDKWAHRAVTHLQQLEVYDYKICQIGSRKIVVNQQALLGPALPARQLEIERLASWLQKASAVELHMVVYCQNDGQQGKAIAEELKQQLSAALGTNSAVPIRISWFDEPAVIRSADGAERELGRGLLIFTQSLTTARSTI